MFSPFIYSNERSTEVFTQSVQFIEDHELADQISEFGWVYYSIGDLIPQTSESFWSGHFFPWVESWEELQISFVLCLFGLYKQAMISLRCGLAVGLLSVYWNLHDDGHVVIQQWLKSQENTPRLTKIWEKLEKHQNFQIFQGEYDIKSRLLSLGFLHDYVHTKGSKFSNRLALMKPNFQTFEEIGFHRWFKAFREVIEVLSILHLVKYPLGIIKYDYDRKFGIDKPSFGGLEPFQVERLEQTLGQKVFLALQKVANKDSHVKEIQLWIDSLPDMTEEDAEEQIVEFDKFLIEHQGLEHWLANEQKAVARLSEQGIEQSEQHKKRLRRLIAWAKENGFEKSILERKQSSG